MVSKLLSMSLDLCCCFLARLLQNDVNKAVSLHDLLSSGKFNCNFLRLTDK